MVIVKFRFASVLMVIELGFLSVLTVFDEISVHILNLGSRASILMVFEFGLLSILMVFDQYSVQKCSHQC